MKVLNLRAYNLTCFKEGTLEKYHLYIPSQNGVLERQNKHVVENRLFMMIKASLPLKF